MTNKSSNELYNLMAALDWRGHVELPQEDLLWLSRELHARLVYNDPTKHLCEACGDYKPVTITLARMQICEECLEEATEIAEETRELLEDK